MSGIMMSTSTDIDVGHASQQLDAGAAAFGVVQLDAVLLERAGQREDVADVVVDDDHLAAGQHRVARAELLQRGLALASGRSSDRRDAASSATLVDELWRSSGRSARPPNDAPARSCRSSLGAEVVRRVDDHRRSGGTRPASAAATSSRPDRRTTAITTQSNASGARHAAAFGRIDVFAISTSPLPISAAVVPRPRPCRRPAAASAARREALHPVEASRPCASRSTGLPLKP